MRLEQKRPVAWLVYKPVQRQLLFRRVASNGNVTGDVVVMCSQWQQWVWGKWESRCRCGISKRGGKVQRAFPGSVFSIAIWYPGPHDARHEGIVGSLIFVALSLAAPNTRCRTISLRQAFTRRCKVLS